MLALSDEDDVGVDGDDVVGALPTGAVFSRDPSTVLRPPTEAVVATAAARAAMPGCSHPPIADVDTALHEPLALQYLSVSKKTPSQ